MTFDVRGLIINEKPYGDGDKLLTVLTKSHGKLSLFAKGARKPKSRYLAGGKLLVYNDFVVFKRGNSLSVTQIDTVLDFSGICADLDKLYAAFLMLELSDKLIYPGMASENCLHLLLLALNMLQNGDLGIDGVRAAFMLKLLQMEGLSPERGFYADADNSVVAAIDYILESDIAKTFRFRVAEGAGRTLYNTARSFLEKTAELDLTSLRVN